MRCPCFNGSVNFCIVNLSVYKHYTSLALDLHDLHIAYTFYTLATPYMTSRLARIASHLKMTKTDIHLYTTGTPNGFKVSILLEELGLKYQVGPALTLTPAF